jgi:excisionase family DNA binding protein
MEQAAEWLGVAPRMVRRLVSTRRIGFVKVGRYVRFHYRHLEQYVEQNERQAFVDRRR